MRVTMRMLSLLRLATNVSAVPSGAQNAAICILPTAAFGSANMRQNGGCSCARSKVTNNAL
jgi:hypothetical protein